MIHYLITKIIVLSIFLILTSSCVSVNQVKVYQEKACDYEYIKSNDQLLIPLRHIKKINENRDDLARLKFTTEINNYNSTDVKYSELANQYLLESGANEKNQSYFAIYNSAHSGGSSRFILIVEKKGNQIYYQELAINHEVSSIVEFCLHN